MKKSVIFSTVVAGGIALIACMGVVVAGRAIMTMPQTKPPVTPTAAPVVAVQISYKGENGIDALTLLKKHALVHLDASGMVDSINGKKAENTKHQYWAFYINGKLAQVGPAQYATHTTDMLMWKIATY